MARNKLAGTKKGTSPSAKRLHNNPEARKKKLAYDKKYQSSPERIKYRSELNQARRDRGIYGKGKGDLSHTKNGKLVLEAAKKNRARNGKNGRSTLK